MPYDCDAMFAEGDTVVYENVGDLFVGTIIRAYTSHSGKPAYDVRFTPYMLPGIAPRICTGVLETQIRHKLSNGEEI